MKTFHEFKTINEGLFDRIFSAFTKIGSLFKNSDTLQKSVETAIMTNNTSSKFLPKSIKLNDTVMVMMGDGKDSSSDFVISFTKLSDLTDGSGIFQISGSSNPVMLKSLIGTSSNEELSKNPILAILPSTGMIKGKSVTMKLFKNMLPDGKDYVTETLMMGAANATAVEQIVAKNK